MAIVSAEFAGQGWSSVGLSGWGELTEVDVSGNTALAGIDVSANPLVTRVAATDCAALESIGGLANRPGLEVLDCTGCQLSREQLDAILNALATESGNYPAGALFDFRDGWSGQGPSVAAHWHEESMGEVELGFNRAAFDIETSNALIRYSHDDTFAELGTEYTAVLFEPGEGYTSNGTGVALQNAAHAYSNAGPHQVVLKRTPSKALASTFRTDISPGVLNFRDLFIADQGVDSFPFDGTVNVYFRLRLDGHNMSVLDLTYLERLFNLYAEDAINTAVILEGVDSKAQAYGASSARSVHVSRGNLVGLVDLSNHRNSRFAAIDSPGIVGFDFTGCTFIGGEIFELSDNAQVTELDYTVIDSGSTMSMHHGFLILDNCTALTQIITRDGVNHVDVERIFITDTPITGHVVFVGPIGNHTLRGTEITQVTYDDSSAIRVVHGGSNNLTGGVTGLVGAYNIEEYSGAFDSNLSQSHVDGILQQLAENVGSYTFVAPLIRLNGPSNAAPGALGLAAIAALVADGVTVITN